jgi:uncharacterized protein (TIGR00725 family)
LIAIVGKGRNCPEETYALAYQVGQLVGGYGGSCVLFTGGLGGVMEAASRGCQQQGGFVVGMLPEEASRTTPVSDFLDLAINTGLSPQVRNVVLAAAVDVMIALPGSHGAFQEMIVALDMGRVVLAVGDHSARLPGAKYLESVETLDSELQRILVSRRQKRQNPGKRGQVSAAGSHASAGRLVKTLGG